MVGESEGDELTNPGYFDVSTEPAALIPHTGSLTELFANPEFEPENKITEAEKAYRKSSNWNNKTDVELSHKHKFIAHLAALGLPSKEIARRVGYSVTWISNVIRHPTFIAEVIELRKEIFKDSLEQRLRTNLDQAATVIEEVLANPNEKSSLRVDTAFRLMDRTHGKPQVRVEHTGSLLKDLFAELDAQKVTPQTEVTDAEWSNVTNTNDVETKPDSVTEFLKENYEDEKK